MSTRIPRSALGLSLLLISSHSLAAQEGDASGWNVEESRAPSTVPLRFTATEGTWMSVDVSPDGTRLAFDLLGHIYEMPIAGGDAVALTSGRSWNMFPRYSPDGASIAFTSDRSGSEDVWVLHRANDSLQNVSALPLPVVQPTWSASGLGIYASVFDQQGASKVYRFNLFGKWQEVTSGQTFQPLTHFEEHTGRGVIFYEHLDQQLHGSGARIKTYDLETGDIDVYRQRPGGAFNPALSPDGRYLAYGHRDDQETVVVLHDLETREERVLVRGLDRDHQEYGPYYYGVSPNMAWHPGGSELFLAYGGRIRAVGIADGTVRDIPFRAPVDRELDETIRFPISVPDGETRTQAHRWAHRTGAGIVFEALGDIYLRAGNDTRNLTSSLAHETDPIVDASAGVVYYAKWTDADLGNIYSRPLRGGRETRLTNRPSQYGSLALTPAGDLAFVRGTGALINGAVLESETDFELVIRDRNGDEHHVTDVSGTPNTQSRLPLTIHLSPDGRWIYYTEFLNDTLTLQRIHPDGTAKTALYRFPHGERAVLSPDRRWIAFREYHRSYVTPFEWIGKPVSVSGYDNQGYTHRVDEADGVYMRWSVDGSTLSWSRGGRLYEKTLDAILHDEDAEPVQTDIRITYSVAVPPTTIALTNARVVTMDLDRSVLESATVVIRGNRIVEAGPDVAVPSGARVFDLAGRTVIPGLVDAHAHPNPAISQTNVVEQRPAGNAAALAHGVTTVYELYGTEEKDPWLTDMIRSGRMDGPRYFSVGAPMYGMREFRPKTYRPVDSYEDALEHVRYARDQGITALKDYVQFIRGARHQLATAARELGLNVVAETAGNAPMNFTQIVDGLTGLEHSMGLTPLYQDVIELFRASGIGVTPTLLVVYNGPSGQSYFNQSQRLWEDPKLLHFARADQLRSFRRVTHFWDDDLYAPEMAAEMKKLFDAGVLINAGGHGQMLGRDMHWEMELFVQGGFTPLDAIQVATRNGAVYHGLGASVGSIEPGKLADMIVLGSNPLDDIRNTRDIEYVIKNGVVYAGDDGARVFPDGRAAGEMYFKR